MSHTPHTLLMLKPNHFGFNPETKNTNSFQHKIEQSPEMVKEKAKDEFNQMVNVLEEFDVNVEVLEDSIQCLPDAIFMNNWLSIFPEGTLVTYPIQSKVRREERRTDIVDYLVEKYDITNYIDLSYFEDENLFLESTGSVVFDHNNRLAFCCASARSSEKVFNTLCDKLNYKGFYFEGINLDGTPIYHTNVMLSIGEKFAVICSDCIVDPIEKSMILQTLKSTKKEIIDVSVDQMNSFSANVFEVKNRKDENVFIISRTAYSSLKNDQIKTIEKYAKIAIVNVSIIERVGGGSSRCMLTAVNC